MKPLRQYEVVRVVRLLRDAQHYDGWRFNKRPPRVGDTGTIVDILHLVGSPENYVVEASLPDGTTLWPGDFSADELEPIYADPG